MSAGTEIWPEGLQVMTMLSARLGCPIIENITAFVLLDNFCTELPSGNQSELSCFVFGNKVF